MSVTVSLNEDASVFTDTNDPTEIFSEQVPAHRGVLFDFSVICMRVSDGATASWHKEGRARRKGTDDVELVGTVAILSTHKDAAAVLWDLQVQVQDDRIGLVGTGPNSDQRWFISGTLTGYDYDPE